MKIRESIKKGLSVATGSMGLVLILFIFGAVWNLINVSLTPRLENPDAGTTAIIVGVGILFILASIFVQAGSLGYVRDRLKLGKAEFASFMASGSKYYIQLLLLGLFIALVVGAFVLLAALVVALLANTLSTLGVILAVVIAAIGIYVAILMFLAPYFIVVDGQKVIASVKNSISLVLTLIGFGIGLVLGLIFVLLSTAMKGAITAQYIFAVLSSFVNAFLGIVVTGSFMHFYLEASNR